MQHPNYQAKEDNTDSVCGASCTETLYEFWCYPRAQRSVGRWQGIRENMDGRFHVLATKECGRHLLGAQSETSKLLEEMATIVRSCIECDGQGAVRRIPPAAFNTALHKYRHFLQELRRLGLDA